MILKDMNRMFKNIQNENIPALQNISDRSSAVEAGIISAVACFRFKCSF